MDGPAMRVLVIDIGGSHIKMAIAGEQTIHKVDSGPDMTPSRMMELVQEGIADWQFEAVTIGYPGPVVDNRPMLEPRNLGGGWTAFDYATAFTQPVRMVNDAAMQALGSYEGNGRMLFLGLGTGLGSAVVDGSYLEPLELAHLPYRKGRSFEDYAGERGFERMGRKKWEKHVHRVTEYLRSALICRYVVLGGGNVRKLEELPPHTKRGSNAHAFRGGGRLWEGGPPGTDASR